MKASAEGSRQCCDAQLADAGGNRAVVAARLGQGASNRSLMPPGQVKATFGVMPKQALADAGCRNEAELARLEASRTWRAWRRTSGGWRLATGRWPASGRFRAEIPARRVHEMGHGRDSLVASACLARNPAFGKALRESAPAKPAPPGAGTPAAQVPSADCPSAPARTAKMRGRPDSFEAPAHARRESCGIWRLLWGLIYRISALANHGCRMQSPWQARSGWLGLPMPAWRLFAGLAKRPCRPLAPEPCGHGARNGCRSHQMRPECKMAPAVSGQRGPLSPNALGNWRGEGVM